MEHKLEYYGISGRLISHDRMLRDCIQEAEEKGYKPPIIINDVAVTMDTIEASEMINQILQNRIVDETLNSAPICSLTCESPITHRYNLGLRCPHCGHVVSEHRITSEVWLRAPDEMGNFINPRFWSLFNAFFGSKLKKFNRNKVTVERGSDLLLWLIDPYYRPEKDEGTRARVVKRILIEHGFERGIRNFVDHHRTVFNILTSPEAWKEIYPPTKNNRYESERVRLEWREFFQEQSFTFFPRHLPIISSKLIVTEERRQGIFIDPVYTSAIDAVKNVALLYTNARRIDPRFIIRRAIKANRQLAYFYIDHRQEVMEGKPGFYRAKLGSTHVPWGGRVTISPISEPHDALKVIAPWRWLVPLASVHIENKLGRRDYTPRQCERIIAFAAMQYVPLVHEIINELIKESPGGFGLMLEVLRNPTLVQLSIQTLFISSVLTDVTQCSLRISDRVIKAPNADFDGDQLQCRMAIDQIEMELGMAYRPDNGFMSSTNVDEVSSCMILHNENISNINRFFQDTEEDLEAGIALDSELVLMAG
ncbi:hypothetical protein EVJ02_17750 [Salmonella enterica subsp. enterica serovar Kedougou]|nr:hypothetical protein [Salmonella enterica subsp. enterica serovar Kedougou]EGH2802900.1 hypothetical protein [Salmonella enterica]